MCAVLTVVFVGGSFFLSCGGCGGDFFGASIWNMFGYVWHMQRFICTYAKYYYTICLKKDILYMCKTEIQIKKDIKWR